MHVIHVILNFRFQIITFTISSFFFMNIGFRVSRRAKNRWLVAYTLLNNPSLRKNKYGYQYKDEEETRERQQSLSNDNGVTLSVAT